MRLTAYARPRSWKDDFLGHIVIGIEGAERAESVFYGYEPRLELLPPHVPLGGQELTDYLFEQAVPGVIVNSTNLVKKWQTEYPDSIHGKSVMWSGDLFEHIPITPGAGFVQHGFYSLEPDALRPEEQPCYNCVKWAHVVTEEMVPGFIPPVEKWRMKHIIALLPKMSESPRT